MDVFLPKFGNGWGDAEQSHPSWQASLLWADSQGKVGCHAGGFEEVMGGLQVLGEIVAFRGCQLGPLG